jgi:predicted nucleotidyltransferase
MRPPSRPSSALFEPFDFLLGSIASVRILRVLSAFGDVMSASRIAERARLGRAGVGRTLASLVELRVVESVGTHSRKVYRLNREHPLVPAIETLFGREAERVDAFLADVRALAKTHEPNPAAIWLYGSVAAAQDNPLSDIDIAIIEGDSPTNDSLARGIVDAAEKYSLHASIIILNGDDIERLNTTEDPFWRNLHDQAVPLTGPSPTSLSGRGK